MGSSLREALLPSRAFRCQPPGVMGIWQLRSHGTSVEGVLQNRDDVAVADWRPIERDQLLAVRRSGKVDLIGRHRKMHAAMHAASAAELTKSLEDLTDGFLDAQIRIEAEAEIAMPDVSDRHADAPLAPPCLGPSGLKHPGAQNAELELADAALHAQEQTVVRATRVVDPLDVNDACFDEPAQFEQVMPVASIARESRGIQAQHSSNVPGAQGRHEPLEAWSDHHAAGGLTQIVIDDLDGVEPPSPRDLDEFVLLPLALPIELDLSGRRLPDIDDGFARQHRGWQEISAVHRHAPSSERRRLREECAPVGR